METELEIDYSGQRLTVFPSRPLQNIRAIYVVMNQIEFLPELPGTLVILHCGINHLKEIPELPDSLRELYVYDNFLEKLPPLKNLRILSCGGNYLPELPEIPDTMEELRYDPNPCVEKYGENARERMQMIKHRKEIMLYRNSVEKTGAMHHPQYQVFVREIRNVLSFL